MTSIRDALGGNSRVSNMIEREGIHTIEALRDLRQVLGERGFEERMSYIRNFGKDSLAKVYQALAGHEENPPAEEENSENLLPGTLPEGLLTRLDNTLRHLIYIRAKSDFRVMSKVAETPSALGVVDVGSLTAGDLEALALLLTGVRWDLDLNEYRMRKESNG